MTEEPLPLGEQVRAAREAAGLTVEQVTARTRIRAALLRELEQGDTTSCGGPVYVRGHLRAIAAATGTDPAPLLRAYEREAGETAPAVPVAVAPIGGMRSGSLGLPVSAPRERRGPRWGAALLAALGVFLVLTGIGLWKGAQTSAPDVLAGPTTTTSPAAPSATASPQPVGPSAVAKVPPASGASLRVRVVKGMSWVNVQSSSGEVLFRGVLRPGTAKDFEDPKRLAVTVGNAGAVNLICGGKDVAAGKEGQVRKYTCAAKGLVPA